MKYLSLAVIVLFISSCAKETEIKKSEYAGEWDGNIVYLKHPNSYITSVFIKVNDAGEVTGTYEYYNSERKIIGKVYSNGIWNANISGHGEKGTIAGSTKDKKKLTGSFISTDLNSDIFEGTIFLFKN